MQGAAALMLEWESSRGEGAGGDVAGGWAEVDVDADFNGGGTSNLEFIGPVLVACRLASLSFVASDGLHAPPHLLSVVVL